jgi:hypothetical protein
MSSAHLTLLKIFHHMRDSYRTAIALTIATDRKLRTTINSQCTRFEGVYSRLVLTALATAINRKSFSWLNWRAVSNRQPQSFVSQPECFNCLNAILACIEYMHAVRSPLAHWCQLKLKLLPLRHIMPYSYSPTIVASPHPGFVLRQNRPY